MTALEKYFQARGMRGLEEQAIEETRRTWLPILEAWLADANADANASAASLFEEEIRRLRKLLGIESPKRQPSPEALERRRAATRERVRRWRAKGCPMVDD
jgi:hypothetical protein